MKYGLGYTIVTRTTGFFSRTLLYFRKTELNYMLNLLKHGKNLKILDYGCNTGYFTKNIKDKVKCSEVFGADINPHALKSARKKNPDITFYDVNEPEFKKQRFDAIVISHVLEHIKDEAVFIQQMSKHLTKKGKLIIAVPQERIRGDATIIQLLYNILRLRFENPHVRTYSYDQLAELLESSGFKISNRVYTNYFPPFKSDKIKIHSWSLVIEALKN